MCLKNLDPPYTSSQSSMPWCGGAPKKGGREGGCGVGGGRSNLFPCQSSLGLGSFLHIYTLPLRFEEGGAKTKRGGWFPKTNNFVQMFKYLQNFPLFKRIGHI